MPRRVYAILAVSLSLAITVLDGVMINVALPGIARGFGIAPATATWLLNAYQLTLVTTLLPLASFGERQGFRPVYLGGFAVFGLAAAGAAFAPSFGALLACRILQGLGASAVMSLTAGLIRHIYPGRQLGRAIGINAMVVATAGAAGPSLAAAILAVAPWQALYAVHVPMVLLGILVGWRSLPDHRGTGQPFDWPSAGLNILAFGLVFLGLDLVLSWTLPALALAMAGLGAGVLLVRRQLSRPAPLLPLDLLGVRVIAFSVAASVCAFAAWYASYVALPFLLQGAGFSQAATGLVMTPWPLGMAVGAPVAGRLADRLPSALLCAAGMAMMVLGLGAAAALPPAGHGVLLGALLAVCGIGFGSFQAPNNRTMLSAAPKARSGGAGGMQATARLLGSTLGTTVVALCFQLAGSGGPRLALLAGLGFAAAAGVLSLVRRSG